MTLTITEINATTGESITRDMTAEEIANHQEQVRIRQEHLAKQEAEAEAKAQAKAVLLERLGLTQEEFNTLTA